MTFHPLYTTTPKPRQFTFPFCYEPHPLCLEAAAMVQRHIGRSGIMDKEHGEGKMFGVLVVEKCGGEEAGGGATLGFVAAYSGLLAGRNDWPWFVPPVFDAQQADGHFKLTETRISAINAEIEAVRHSPAYAEAAEAAEKARAEAAGTLEQMRREAAEAKAKRHARRAEATPISAQEAALMERESQHLKASIRRARKHFEALCAEKEAPLKAFQERIDALKKKRRAMSDDLQRWLFSQYRMLNARGEERDLCDIFAHTVHHVPPAGAGDCCAPKLLQYAYTHNMRPVCMAEFWWGASPAAEIRHHLHYYPACRGKCLPILTHMLEGLDVEPNPLTADGGKQAEIIYEDDHMAVVLKPDGMLSVPGKEKRAALTDIMQRHWGNGSTALAAHRLDMHTSGLMLVARDMHTCRLLQQQFAAREVKKEYVALLDGVPHRPRQGTISLPLAPDMMDRPRQTVDEKNGKTAVTRYETTATDGRHTLVRLWPHTGRTHQLRVHCAHPLGLGCPIHGDPLYGHPATRLCLHAARITFTHPITGKVLTFESKPPFSLDNTEGIAEER